MGLQLFEGIRPELLKTATEESVRKARARVASKAANQSKQNRAEERARIARLLQVQGKTQEEIAAAIGIKSTRGVRKLLARK